MSLARSLYKAARTVNTVSAVASGKPGRAGRRARNIVVGRSLAKAGVFRRLYR